MENYKNLQKVVYKKEDCLIRELASFQIAVEFERLFKDIFKSQLDALEKLNISENGLKRESLFTYYEKASNETPSAYQDFSFDNWLNFLYMNDLIMEKNELIISTLKAKVFIKYILQQRGYNISYKGL